MSKIMHFLFSNVFPCSVKRSRKCTRALLLVFTDVTLIVEPLNFFQVLKILTHNYTAIPLVLPSIKQTRFLQKSNGKSTEVWVAKHIV